MKKYLIIIGVIVLGAASYLLFTKNGKAISNVATSNIETVEEKVNEEGLTVKDRITLPEGFERVEYPDSSFQGYVQNYALKPFGAKVINYDGREYGYQKGHVGVLDLPVPKNGLQQCADALMRIRAEYLWANDRKDEIGFNFTSGDYCSWKSYAEGIRPKVNNNKVQFNKIAVPDDSERNFYRYLNLIYIYSGTMSLYSELPKVTKVEDLQVGDMLIRPGSPGHVVMIVDEAQNEDGDKIFILAQGNTPAQSVHVLKNFNDEDMSPWYELEMNAYLEIPTYYFDAAKFIRFKGV